MAFNMSAHPKYHILYPENMFLILYISKHVYCYLFFPYNYPPNKTSTSPHKLRHFMAFQTDPSYFPPNSLPETAPPPTFRNFLPWHERPAMPTYPGNSSAWCEDVVKPTCSHQSRRIWSDVFMGENRDFWGGHTFWTRSSWRTLIARGVPAYERFYLLGHSVTNREVRTGRSYRTLRSLTPNRRLYIHHEWVHVAFPIEKKMGDFSSQSPVMLVFRGWYLPTGIHPS